MKNTILITAALLATFARGAWTIEESRDEMTDELTYYAYVIGDEVRVMDFVKYRPQLQATFTPVRFEKSTNTMQAKMKVYFSITSEGLVRGSFPATVRIDKQPSQNVIFKTSTDRRAGFFPNGPDTVGDLKGAKDLRIRFVTTLDAVRTLHFDVSGLTAAIEEIKKRINKTRPVGVEIIE